MANVITFGNAYKSLSELTTDDSKAIIEMYKKAKSETLYEISKLNLKSSLTVSESLRKTQLNHLLESINHNLKELEEQQSQLIKGSVYKVSNAVVQNNLSWLSGLGLTFEGKVAHVPQDVIANIMSGKLYGNDWNFSSAIWGINNKSKGVLSDIVSKGIAENKSSLEIAKDLEKYVTPAQSKPSRVIKYPKYEKNPDGTFKKDANGKRIPIPGKYGKFYFGNVDYNAQRLARTMVAHAYQQSIIETCKQNPYVEKIMWRAAMVERTCELCESRNGKMYDLNNVPMDHPNGMCTFEAVLTKNLDAISDDLANWVNGEDNERLDDYMTYLTGEDFHKQYNELQKKWLASKRYSPYTTPEFSEWSHKLTSAEKTELFDTLNLHSEAHPFQKMELWYNENLSVSKYSFELAAEKELAAKEKSTVEKVFNEIQKEMLSPLGFSPDNMPKSGKQFAEFVYDKYQNLTSTEYLNNYDYWKMLETNAGINQVIWSNDTTDVLYKLKKYYNNNLKFSEVKDTVNNLGVKSLLTKESKAILSNAYSQERLDAGIWFYDAKDADAALRSKIAQLWKNTYTEPQKEALYLYTSGSDFMNRPLRGYDYSWSNFLGIGKVSLDNENDKGEYYINKMTEAISKSFYNKDYWLNRGVGTDEGMASFLGVKADWLMNASNEDLQSLVGKVVTDEGFMSCGTTKGTGFGGHKMNIFCPAGTHMIYAEPWSHYGGNKSNYNQYNSNVYKNFWDGKKKQNYFGSEDETIIQRGTSFVITKIRSEYGQIYLECAVSGQKY